MSKKKHWHSLSAVDPQKQFPPPFKTTLKVIDKLAKRYDVHENPAVPPCPTCGMKYDDFRTGLDFQAVKDMLWTGDPDPNTWRHKRRNTVLGLWFQLKQSMWRDHLEMCEDPSAQEEWFKQFDPQDFVEY
jgi:hypothetical protein